MKPTVYFKEVIDPPVAGWRAVVRLEGGHHTLTDEVLAIYDGIVTTSTVKAVREDGSFETQNTIYVPLDQA